MTATTQAHTSWILETVRRREADLADACATAAVHVRDVVMAGRLAELVFEHLRHARPLFECTKPCSPEVEVAALRARIARAWAQPDTPWQAAVDRAIAGAVARAHAELALFIDDACATLLVAPFERERLLRLAFCTASLGEQVVAD